MRPIEPRRGRVEFNPGTRDYAVAAGLLAANPYYRSSQADLEFSARWNQFLDRFRTLEGCTKTLGIPLLMMGGMRIATPKIKLMVKGMGVTSVRLSIFLSGLIFSCLSTGTMTGIRTAAAAAKGEGTSAMEAGKQFGIGMLYSVPSMMIGMGATQLCGFGVFFLEDLTLELPQAIVAVAIGKTLETGGAGSASAMGLSHQFFFELLEGGTMMGVGRGLGGAIPKVRLAYLNPATEVGATGNLEGLPSPNRLQEALDRIDSVKIGEDVAYLASERLEGRATPSEGLTAAGDHLMERLRAASWKEGSTDGYRYLYYLRRGVLDNSGSEMRLRSGGGEEVLRHGADYIYTAQRPRPFRHATPTFSQMGELVDCGTGSREALQGKDIRGKWILCHDSELSPEIRQQNARRKGAAGILVIAETDPGRRGLLHLGREKGICLTPFGGRIDEIFLTSERGSHLIERLRGEDSVEVSRTDAARSSRVEVANICGLLPGSDPKLAHEVIVMTAHYDHLGIIDGKIHPGADDNASGSSALLALAEALPKLEHPRTILLLWTSGEELGLLGSWAWVRNPKLPLPEGRRVVANINLDMIGRGEEGRLFFAPSPVLKSQDQRIARKIEENAHFEGIREVQAADRYWMRSDHFPFVSELKVPAAFIFGGMHDDYHQPTDTADRVRGDLIAQRTRLVLRVLDDLRNESDFRQA